MHDPGPPHARQAADSTVDEVTCREFVELITDYFEGALPRRTLNRVEEHLVMCDWCVTYMEQLQATIALMSQLSEPPAQEPPTQPPERVLAALAARRRAGR